MKRNVLLAAVVISLLAAAPSWAALPFGSFGGQIGGGNTSSGIALLFGWALDDVGVAAIDIVVDGVIDGRATYGRSRPAVQAAFPSFPNAGNSGWVYALDTTHYLNGTHTVVPRVRSTTGEIVNLAGRSFAFNNTPHDLAPFGKIEFPNQNAEIFGTCGGDCAVVDNQDGLICLRTPRRYTVVSGYVLDSGVQASDQGVAYVELLIDRAIVYNSKTSCFYNSITGGLTNCYGIRRPDIDAIYPTLRDGLHSGFRFVLDYSQLFNDNLYLPGHHTLAIRAGDFFGTVTEISEIPVTFSCDDFIGNDGGLGAIDTPANGLLYSGVVQTTGWGLDFQGVAAITILLDGNTIGSAVYGFPRPGVSSQYPGFPDSAAPGWVYALDTTKFSNGQHSLQAIIVDNLGVTTLIGERHFTIANNHQ
ncbi:MAG TPA: hypothetical protein VOA87_01485 [Thermoanaerobaculia bacterium]|nr:hypothetical protein [Thermoanaerobaculia bacterium]